MVILKKLRAATLIEVLVAVLIIVTIFMVASTSLQNMFLGDIKNNDHELRNRVKEINYLLENDKLQLPFEETTKDWELYITTREDELNFEVINKKSNSSITYSTPK